MSIFVMLHVLEVKLFQEFLKPKEKFYEDEELHLLKITNDSYDYCSCNFLRNNISINKENPMIDNYLTSFAQSEIKLYEVIRDILKHLDINVDEVESFEYLAGSIKNYYTANIEKYFFQIFENGILHYSKEEYKEALNEFLVAKFFYESIIFIRIISSNKSETTDFFKIFEMTEIDDELNLLSDSKKVNQPNSNLFVFTFLGGIIKTFKGQKIIEEEPSSESLIVNSNEAFESLIRFYPEIMKLVIECSKNT